MYVFFHCSATAELEQYGEVESFLGQQASSQQQVQTPLHTSQKESPGMLPERNQSSPFFTMSSSSSGGHDDFLSPAQNVMNTSSGYQTPTANLTAVGSGTYTPSRPSATPPQSFPPTAASWSQSPPKPVSKSPQTPSVGSTVSCQTSPQPATSFPQTLPQPVVCRPPSTPSTSSTTQSAGPSQPHTSPQPLSHCNVPSSQQVQSVPAPVLDPVQPHWFYRKGASVWVPFSFIDSENLEQALKSSSASGDRIVATDGGRYDVNLDKRLRYPLYWEEPVSVVRRCTWFYKGDGESKLVPYMEDMAARLEVRYKVPTQCAIKKYIYISQSGSFFPHDILNRVISKMVWVKL